MQVTFLKSSKALNNSRLERNRRTFITTCLTLSERHFWPQYFEPLWTQRLIFKSINDLFLERNKFCHSRISFVFKFSLQFRSMILNSKFINDIMFEMSSSCLYSYLRHCALKRYNQTPTVPRVPTFMRHQENFPEWMRTLNCRLHGADWQDWFWKLFQKIICNCCRVLSLGVL